MPAIIQDITPSASGSIGFIQHAMGELLATNAGQLNPIHPLSNTAIVRIGGDAMSPTYPEGALVLIDADVRGPSPAGVFVIRDRDRLTVQRCQIALGSKPPMVHLLPDNPSHKHETVPVASLDVVGQVICRIGAGSVEVTA